VLGNHLRDRRVQVALQAVAQLGDARRFAALADRIGEHDRILETAQGEEIVPCECTGWAR
jgi:hypothetical protein